MIDFDEYYDDSGDVEEEQQQLCAQTEYTVLVHDGFVNIYITRLQSHWPVWFGQFTDWMKPQTAANEIVTHNQYEFGNCDQSKQYLTARHYF